MLFFLTGDIQTGKTRWLSGVVDELEARGVEVCGVMAPGVWKPGARPGEFEKLGIDNLLLPERVLVPFARRRDLALEAGAYDAGSQSARADLAWAIDDAAISRVNEHFARLAGLEAAGAGGSGSGRLLVVDELGRLELMRGEGLTQAVALLERGATGAFAHAVVIVREQLLELAREHFAHAPWGGMRAIVPGEAAERELRGLYA